MRTYLTITLLLTLVSSTWANEADPEAKQQCETWPQWQQFTEHFISASGRVVDIGSEKAITTSEGQSYALFFALVANDPTTFARVLHWTEDNLAKGDLGDHLPAWLWGRQGSNTWGVLDPNPASDADLWIAYSLLEAGRIWQQPRYTALGELLALRILREEAVTLPGAGTLLLPAPFGFVVQDASTGEQRWRLNPSYSPLQLLRRVSLALPTSGWEQLHPSTGRLLLESAPAGAAPDWVAYTLSKGLHTDLKSKGIGSYDAIRVYLWAGMLDDNDPLRTPLLTHFKPMTNALNRLGMPPHSIDSRTGRTDQLGPPGFSAALLPFLAASGAEQALQTQLKRLLAEPLGQDNYYNQVLGLFGQGWQQQRYRFDADGLLHFPRNAACS